MDRGDTVGRMEKKKDEEEEARSWHVIKVLSWGGVWREETLRERGERLENREYGN